MYFLVLMKGWDYLLFSWAMLCLNMLGKGFAFERFLMRPQLEIDGLNLFTAAF